MAVTPIEVEIEVLDPSDTFDLFLDENEDVGADVEDIVEVTTSDYEKLHNKPSINGTTLIGNYDEKDPTVPDWAKDEEPKELDYSDIKDAWDSIFK